MVINESFSPKECLWDLDNDVERDIIRSAFVGVPFRVRRPVVGLACPVTRARDPAGGVNYLF